MTPEERKIEDTFARNLAEHLRALDRITFWQLTAYVVLFGVFCACVCFLPFVTGQT